MEAVAERPNGTRIPFIPYPTPQFDASGRLTGAVNMLVDITTRSPEEFPNAFATIRKEGARGLVVSGDPMFALNAEGLSKLAIENRIPTVGANRREAVL